MNNFVGEEALIEIEPFKAPFGVSGAVLHNFFDISIRFPFFRYKRNQLTYFIRDDISIFIGIDSQHWQGSGFAGNDSV